MDPKIILIVEDEVIIHRLLKRLLEPLGHEIRGATSLAEGIEKMDAPRLDLLIADLKLPNGTGVDAIRQFKVKFPRSKTLIVTGSVSPEDHLNKASELGVTHCLYKPFKIEELVATVQSLLSN